MPPAAAATAAPPPVRRVGLVQFLFEANTFAPPGTDLGVFRRDGVWLDEPAAVRAWCATGTSQLAESVRVLEAAGAVAVPAFVAVCGCPAGRLASGAWRELRAALLAALARTLPADALLLHLHGAACAEDEDDCEGDLLEAVRRELGFTGRVVVSLDLHANVTDRMLRHADAFTAYRTFPHCDFAETGRRAAELVRRPGRGHRVMLKVPALIPPPVCDHRTGWFRDLLAAAQAHEAAGAVDDVGLFPVQPWLDVDELGSAVLVTGRDLAAARRVALDLGRRWWAAREGWDFGLRAWPDIVGRLRQGGGPWYLVDTGDATTGGATGRSAEALRQLLPHADTLPGEVLLWVVDERVVAQARAGAAEFEVGDQRVRWRADARFLGEFSCRMRGGVYTGLRFAMGLGAVLAAGRIRLVACERPTLAADPAFYEAAGLDPTRSLAVQVKSFSGWQAGFGVGPERGLYFDGPGATSLRFGSLPFRAAARSLRPMNPEAQLQETLHEHTS